MSVRHGFLCLQGEDFLLYHVLHQKPIQAITKETDAPGWNHCHFGLGHGVHIPGFKIWHLAATVNAMALAASFRASTKVSAANVDARAIFFTLSFSSLGMLLLAMGRSDVQAKTTLVNGKPRPSLSLDHPLEIA